MRVIDRREVAERLTYDLAIPIVREAMIAFSTGQTRQLLRSIKLFDLWQIGVIGVGLAVMTRMSVRKATLVLFLLWGCWSIGAAALVGFAPQPGSPPPPSAPAPAP